MINAASEWIKPFVQYNQLGVTGKRKNVRLCRLTLLESAWKDALDSALMVFNVPASNYAAQTAAAVCVKILTVSMPLCAEVAQAPPKIYILFRSKLPSRAAISVQTSRVRCHLVSKTNSGEVRPSVLRVHRPLFRSVWKWGHEEL